MPNYSFKDHWKSHSNVIISVDNNFKKGTKKKHIKVKLYAIPSSFLL